MLKKIESIFNSLYALIERNTLNMVLIFVLILHASPYGLEMVGQYDFDRYILLLLSIILVQSIIIFTRMNLKLQRILAGCIIVISLYFLVNYAMEPWHNEVSVFQLIGD